MEQKSIYSYPDIYFEPSYARLYETENDEAVANRFECAYGIVSNSVLERRINIFVDDNTQFYNITTPYGYGGLSFFVQLIKKI